ncbi:MAG: YndJ family transporter [Acidimicrobiales bacterium]|nr:YndJ family transporter [Acidimicrobiales bacterium]
MCERGTTLRRIDLIDVLSAAGPVVVVGLGLVLVDRLLGDDVPAPLVLARGLRVAGAAAAVASLVISPGGLAGAFALGWFVVCLCAAAGGVALLARLRSPSQLAGAAPAYPLVVGTVAVGLVYLGVAGAWLVISRFGLRPFDLSTDIVRLTSVHFHYAGFGLPLLGAAGLSAVDWLASRLALVTGCLTAIAGPPVVASGFVLDWAVGHVGGAVIMTIAAWSVAFGIFLLSTSTSALASVPVRGRGVAQGIGRSLLVVSSLCPWVPMVLAVQWALAQHVSVPALTIDAMASTHGVLNGIGFVAGGLTGWLLTGLPVAGGPQMAPAAR